MKRPSPFVLTALLLIAALFVVDSFLLRSLLVSALVIVGYIVVRPLFARAFRTRRRGNIRTAMIGALIGTLGIIAFLAMLGTQPRLQATYQPDQFSATADIVEQRGFYRTETDAAGNRYVWTQDRATLVFDFLVHKPITLTVTMRSAAVAGGPDTPVQVLVNGQEVGAFHPDPTNAAFQSQSIQFVPYNWGGERTEIKLIPVTFKPKGDSRTLGTMIQSITIDKSHAWSTIGRRMWLLWTLPPLAIIVLGLACSARRFRSPVAGYGAIAMSAVGGGCAIAIAFLVLRIGFIERDTYQVWTIGSAYFALCFLGAAVLLPFGPPEATSLFQRLHAALIRYPFASRTKAWIATRTQPTVAPPPPRSMIVRDLSLLFLVAFGVRLLWVTMTPPWEAPDELDHFIYVSHIVEQREIPRPPYPNYPPYSNEVAVSTGLALLGELSAVGASRATPELPYLPVSYDYSAARQYSATGTDRFSSAGGRATTYPPLYYLFEAIPYALFHGKPILARLFAVRAGSAILGALACLFAYLIGYEVRRLRRWGWAMGLSMALLPMFVFIGAIANNDAAMDLGATALIWLLVRLYQRQTVSGSFALVIGLVSGLTLLTKPGPLPVVIGVGIVMLIKAFPLMRGPVRLSGDKLRALALYTAGGVAGYGPWVFFRYHYYGDFSPGVGAFTHLFRTFSGMTTVAAAPASQGQGVGNQWTPPAMAHLDFSFLSYLQHEHHQGWPYFHWLLIKSVWGYFGWLEVPMPNALYTLITLFCLLGLAGLIIQIILQPTRRPLLLLISAMVALQVIFLFFVVDYYEGFARSGQTILQGRYFFPVLAPFLLLVLSGWDCLFREHPIALRLAPLCMVGVQCVAIATMLARYYGVVIG